MRIMEFIEKYKIPVVIFLLIIYLSNTSPIISPLKEISLASPGTYKFIQTGGVVAALGTILKLIGPWGLAIGSILILGPWIFDSWKGLFIPEPTIPVWAIIGAFIVLIFIILKKK